MTLVQRLARYVSAWANFQQIRELDLNRMSLEEMLDRAFAYSGGFFEPVQIKSEILGALREIQKLRPRYIVEVGTAGGGTLLLWSRVAHPEATIVTLDLPGGDFGGGSSKLRMPLFRRLPLKTQTLHLIRDDSHRPETLALAKKYLDGHAADFLFIDADHTAEGVRSDFSMYSPLVRPGGMIAFHDIAITRPEYGVRALWSELKPKYEHQEFIGEPLAYGIGLLRVPAS
jgi:predicted O-methyltransferase YrrM